MAAFSRCLISILFLIGVAQGRILSLNSSGDQLISDGINGEDSNLSTCRHQYGFLPCGENAAGYFFLIVVYEVLLVVGGMIIGSGSEVLFYITGEKFGGIVLRISRALPSMALMICTGISTTKETAQAQVSSVVGIYAGTTVFSLTVQWFMYVVTASRPLKEEEEGEQETSSSKLCSPIREKLRILIDNGVCVDPETCKTAKVMLLSLIPYVVLQLAYSFFDSSTWKRIITLISLVVSASSLIAYFAYQVWGDPWMQKRSLDYSKINVVQRELLQHVEKLGKLVNEDGTPNEDLIKKFFEKTDKNRDKLLTADELNILMCDLFKEGKTGIKHDNALATVKRKLNFRNDRITKEEFVQAIIQWINEAKNTNSSLREMIQKAVQKLKDENKNNASNIDKIMSKVLKQCEGQVLESEALITDSGEPNIERIRHLFREYMDKDGFLSPTELKRLIRKVKFRKYHMKDEDVVKEMFRVFDKDGNKLLDEEEFMNGIQGYLEKAKKVVNAPDKTSIVQEFDEVVWKEPVYGKKDIFKSSLQFVVGLAILTFMAGPLLRNLLNLSDAVKAPSFLVSFVVVPLALNSQAAIASLLPASKKTYVTSSLTFSEIYVGVIMNNLSGLTALLAIVYAKGLTWDYSAEVLTILAVCAMVGAHASCNTTYKFWTCIPIILLYPTTLVLFYYFQVVYM